MEMDFNFSWIIIVVASIIGLWIILYFIPIGLWFTALLSGVRISLLQLILMRWRKVPPTIIVASRSCAAFSICSRVGPT